MRDLLELKMNDGKTSNSAFPIRREQIALVESLAGVSLPQAYIDFLSFSNGGHAERDTLFPRENSSIKKDWAIDLFFHIQSDSVTTSDMQDLLWNYARRPANVPRELIPFGRDGGGNLFYMDLTKDGNGQVVIQLHDELGFPTIVIADSFEDFIDRLDANPDYI